MGSDLEAVRDFSSGETDHIANPSVLPRDSIWTIREFRSNSATSKMLALMLAHAKPVDLLTGQSIDVGKSLAWNNDKEYHHFFPRNYLMTKKVSQRRGNAIANIILLTSHSNIAIRDRAPSDYLDEIRSAVGEDELRRRLSLALISEEAYVAAMYDNYDEFLKIRASDLQQRALNLVGEASDTTVDPSPSSADDSDVDPID